MALVIKIKSLFSRVPKPVNDYRSFSSSIDCDSEIVKSVIEILIHQRSRTRWSSLRFLLSSARLSPQQVSQVALGIKSKPHLALRFFEFTLSHPNVFSHDLSSFSTLAHVLSRARLRHSAQDVMRLALRSPDSFNHAKPVTKFFDLLASSYHECDSAPFVFDLLLMTCLDLKKTDEALDIARKLRSSGINPQTLSRNKLISSVTKLKGFNEGYTLYKELFGLKENAQTRHHRPNTNTFNALMEGCLKHNEVGFMGEIWEEMERVGCLPDNQTYSIYMEGFSEAGKIDEVERLWEEMKGKKMDPDVVCYNTVIGALCKGGSVLKAEEIQRDMGEKGVDSTNATYDHLVRGFCRAGDVGAALLLYNEMRRRKFDAECGTVCGLIEALCEKGKVCEAFMVKEGVMGMGLREKSYEVLIVGLCGDGRVKEALNIQAEMAGKGYKPSEKLYDVCCGV